jgi:hypothetical protein
MLTDFLGVLLILISPLCALALSCDHSPIQGKDLEEFIILSTSKGVSPQ